MVKEAVQQMKSVMTENKEHRQTTPAAAQRGTTITGLREEAASFAKLQQRVKSDEKVYSGNLHVPLAFTFSRFLYFHVAA